MKASNRFFVLGDSVMKGVIYENGRYSLCRNNNFASFEDSGIEVVNKSRMGATIDKGIAVFDKNQNNFDENSVILLEYGGNDCDFDWAKVSENPDGENNPHILLPDFTKKYESLIKKAKETGAKVIVSNLVPIDCEKFFSFITKGRSEKNILRFLGDKTMLSRWQEYYNNAVCKIAENQDCPVIDIRTPFLMSHAFKELLCEDGIHPTNAGYKLIEETVKGELFA